jgi:arylsulfatase A-like enzyme
MSQNLSAERFDGVVGRTYRDSKPHWAQARRAPEGAPNIVLLVLDDVGFAHLGCYGSDIRTPRIDALAAGGLRYTNYHTTAMCSPTRASLLTGRQHHAAGMGTIVEWCTGYPGYQGQVSKRACTLAEVLREHGYNNHALGKWHLMRMTDATAAGPFDYWPLSRGFDRYYGFLSSLTDHWNPELFCDNHPISKPQKQGYHLTEDLIDQAIGFIRDQQCAAPGKPFFSYVALGACHSPHHVAPEYIARYKGQYDAGWDVVREQWFQRQLQLGVIPSDTQLTARNGEVRPWDSLSADEKRVAARMQEVFAGFLEHTDEQVGRLVDYLASIGQLDNTLFVVMSDNGASDEGGDLGNVNIRKHYAFVDESIDELLANIDVLGSEHTYNHYPKGWGFAGNTPLKWFKMDTFGGGIRAPLIVHWPQSIRKGGELRTQYHHCADFVPTVLELLNIQAPVEHQGVPQLPIHGTSMVYSFNDADAATHKTVQYYEMLGDRGLWHQGWKAVTRHHKGDDFEQDRWELYHVDQDFSENQNLAESHPDKLRELVERWWSEAGRYDVLPLDDRDRERTAASLRATSRPRYTYRPGMARVDRLSAPNIANRSYRIEADITLTSERAHGVLFAAGGRFGGYALYMERGHLVHEYNCGGPRRLVVESPAVLPAGRHVVAFEFRKTGSLQGIGTLYVNNAVVGSLAMDGMWPLLPNATGVHCGRDDGSPVSERYACPNAFTDLLHEVAVTLENDQEIDFLKEYHAALADD